MEKHKHMKNNIKIFVALIALVPGIATACFPQLSLGEYNLGEWSNHDRSWVISAQVGDIKVTANSPAALLQQRDDLVSACATEGKALTTQGQTYLRQKKANLGAQFSCASEDLVCNMFEDTFRKLWVQSEGAAIDDEETRMVTWYTENITLCEAHFNSRYQILKQHICQ